MTAKTMRLMITIAATVLAAIAFMTLAPSDWSWVAALVIFLVGGAIAEAVFRRKASQEEIRSDLEDRVRNPPS